LPTTTDGFRIPSGVLIVFSVLNKIFRRGEADCNEVRRLSSDFLEGDLPPPKLSAIQTHLNNCGPCRAFVDTLSYTIGILSRFPRVPVPPSFKRSVIERIRREE
jgi:predicted anti-sigma-YlaC factor YlaD